MSASSTKNANTLKRTASRSLDAPPPKRKLPWLMSQASSSTMSRHPSLDPLEVIPPLNFFVPQPMVEVAVLDNKETDKFGIPKKQIFTIHHNVLAHYSISFRRFLNADTNFNKMTLHGCEAAFGILQNWFYTQKIEGPCGAIKLMEYAKLWKLAKDLIIDDLVKILFGRMEITEPGRDHEKGNTLKDFQAVAYMGNYRGLEDIAISKTLSAMNKHNVEQILKTMPDGMRHGFTLAMMKGCVALTGWKNGLGFDDVDNDGPHRRLRRRTAKLGDKVNEALGEKVAANCLKLFYDSSSDGESFEYSDDELVPETELLDQDELDNGARIVIDESNRYEDDFGFDHMPIYEDDEPELDLQEFVAESEDDDDDLSDESNDKNN
ncbi:hypothetical protein DL98DRAFT_590031 [Cadophora sp. DSE1049]|nr:hypothetical protein DL98DRAFT_590031 [Cadophora sp. DSE1049]